MSLGAHVVYGRPSCPSWARGLKYKPHRDKYLNQVVPLVGTWIEMTDMQDIGGGGGSCPSWARGLKFSRKSIAVNLSVVPLVGTWIEIPWSCRVLRWICRAPRGHVD